MTWPVSHQRRGQLLWSWRNALSDAEQRTNDQDPKRGEARTPADTHHYNSEPLAAVTGQFKAFAKDYKENNEKYGSKDITRQRRAQGVA
jgi:hypothetical protein